MSPVQRGSDNFFVGDIFEDRRQPGYQDAAASGTAAGQQLPQGSQPVPPGEPLDDSPLRRTALSGTSF